MTLRPTDRNMQVYRYFLEHMHSYAHRVGFDKAGDIISKLKKWETTVEVNGSLSVALEHYLSTNSKRIGVGTHLTIDRLFYQDRNPADWMNEFMWIGRSHASFAAKVKTKNRKSKVTNN